MVSSNQACTFAAIFILASNVLEGQASPLYKVRRSLAEVDVDYAHFRDTPYAVIDAARRHKTQAFFAMAEKLNEQARQLHPLSGANSRMHRKHRPVYEDERETRITSARSRDNALKRRRPLDDDLVTDSSETANCILGVVNVVGPGEKTLASLFLDTSVPAKNVLDLSTYNGTQVCLADDTSSADGTRRRVRVPMFDLTTGQAVMQCLTYDPRQDNPLFVCECKDSGFWHNTTDASKLEPAIQLFAFDPATSVVTPMWYDDGGASQSANEGASSSGDQSGSECEDWGLASHNFNSGKANLDSGVNSDAVSQDESGTMSLSTSTPGPVSGGVCDGLSVPTDAHSSDNDPGSACADMNCPAGTNDSKDNSESGNLAHDVAEEADMTVTTGENEARDGRWSTIRDDSMSSPPAGALDIELSRSDIATSLGEYAQPAATTDSTQTSYHTFGTYEPRPTNAPKISFAHSSAASSVPDGTRVASLAADGVPSVSAVVKPSAVFSLIWSSSLSSSSSPTFTSSSTVTSGTASVAAAASSLSATATPVLALVDTAPYDWVFQAPSDGKNSNSAPV